MSNRKQLDIVRWLSELAIRCEPRTTENLEVMARDYARDLAHLPQEAFTDRSRNACSLHFDKFPTFKQLHTWLEKWWSANKPAPLSLPPVDDPNLNDTDRAQVRSWINLRKEGDLNQRLSLIRSISERAFAYIIRTDEQAMAIAKRRGWMPSEETDLSKITEVGIARHLINLEQLAGAGPTGQALASFGLNILRKGIGKHAPDRLHLLPDKIHPPTRQPREQSDSAQDKAAFANAQEQLGKLKPDYDAIDAQAAARDKAVRDAQAAKYRSGNADARVAAAIRPETGSSPPPETPRTSDVPPPANDTDRWVPDWEGADA